jgi:hypothetical protein
MTQNYKKTDRVRKTASHERLEAFIYGTGAPGEVGHIHGLKFTLQDIIGREISIDLSRSEEQRYARALFDLDIGGVLVKGKTAEEILQVVAGVVLVREIQTSAVTVEIQEEIKTEETVEETPEVVAEKPPVKVRVRKRPPSKKIAQEAEESPGEDTQAA